MTTATLAATATPPGPSPRLAWPRLFAFNRDPIGFTMAMARTYGDVAAYQLGPQPFALLSNPEDIRDVLVTNNRNFVKGVGLARAKRLLGEGLLTSEGDFWRRQRRLAQPAFHRQRIAGYANTMVAYAERHASRWQPGDTRDIAEEMMALTLAIVGKTLFDSDVEGEASEVGAALNDAIALFSDSNRLLMILAEQVGIQQNARLAQTRNRLDAIIYRMIDEHRASGDDRGDLLSMLLQAHDAEGDGSGMTDQQVRDEALTIFLAGHETTANALTWTFYLLSQNPTVAQQLYAELDAVLGKRLPTMDDLPQLHYTDMVIHESMRLYPPAWIIGRRALNDFTAGGYRIPANTTVLMSQWQVQHDPRFFPDPYRFDPLRWLPEARSRRHKYSYFPFGGGPRQCIGEQFALMEMVLVLATLARRWRLHLVPGHPVTLQPSITLRPKHGMRMRLERRHSHG
ncbi:MAG: cytochrome P450 [Chloroflexaceae bacterium]|jgi:cytochrome P450|nr:cytochrome P450 [Chloroflexaceae bacterium]